MVRNAAAFTSLKTYWVWFVQIRPDQLSQLRIDDNFDLTFVTLGKAFLFIRLFFNFEL